MGLLNPKKKRRKPLRSYTTMHCVAARNQVGYCRGLCTPIDGVGPCGRVAPHALIGRTQTALVDHGAITERGTFTVPKAFQGGKHRGGAVGSTMGFSYAAQVVEVGTSHSLL